LNQFITNFYPGWRVHAGAFCCALIVAGCTSYIFGLFVIPVSEEFALSRANVNNGYIAFLLGVGILSPIVGHLLDKLSARLIVCSGGMLFGCGMIGICFTESLLSMLLLIAGPIAFGMAACGTLAANTVVVRWFNKNRGKALGVLAVSTSAGGFIFTPFTALMIESFGWRTALLILGLIAIVVIAFMTAFLIRNHPKGSEPGYSGEFKVAATNSGTEVESTTQHEEWRYSQLLCNRNFWLLTLGIGLLYGSDQALVTANVPYFQDIGIDLSAAALIVAFMTVSAIFGKVLVGILADKFDLRYIFYVVAGAHLALLAVYLLQPPYWVLLVLATLFGVGMGGVFPVWTTLLAWLFGSRSYGTIMGLMTVLFKVLSIIAVRFVGEVHDATGSYSFAFVMFSVVVVVAVILISMLTPEKNTQDPIPNSVQDTATT